MSPIKQLTDYENGLIADFKNHELFQNRDGLSNPSLEEILLERAQLSFEFTKILDVLLRGIEDKKLRTALEWLAREEYPVAEMNHRAALVHDLQLLGIPKEKIMNYPASQKTALTIAQFYEVLRYGQPYLGKEWDIHAGCFFRFGFETVIPTEYGHFIAEFLRPERGYGIESREELLFYSEHEGHDENHAEVLRKNLARLITTPQELAIAQRATKAAYDIKSGFYEQEGFMKQHGA